MRDDFRLDLQAYEQLFNEHTRLVSVTHVSNVLGTVNPVEELIRIAHEHGVPVLVDAAQSAPHKKLDVQQMDCDFLALSGHKMYGPTGIGVLYGKESWLEKLPPYQGGGEMIDKVTWERTTFERLPFKFEAGTPDYVATHGLATAIDYLCSIGLDAIEAHEKDLGTYAREQLQQIGGIHIYAPTCLPDQEETGAPMDWGGALSFNVGNHHHLDIGTLLDRLGIAVRTGHHCAQPLMDRLGVQGTVRASFALYNTRAEVDALVAGLQRVVRMLG
jgi:cysteine desulfurase/selenocysteine lyase